IEYWRDELCATPGHFRDFGDQPHVVPRRLLVHSEKFVIAPSLCRNLRRLAENYRADLEAILLTVFRAILQRYGSGEAVPIALGSSSQEPEERHGMIGCFANYLVLTAPPNTAGLSLAELIQQTAACRTHAAQHGRLSLQTILEKC